MKQTVFRSKVAQVVTAGLIAAIADFGCGKKPEPDPLCKANNGSLEFTIMGNEKDLPPGATNVQPIHSLKGKTVFVTFRLPDKTKEFKMISFKEFMERQENGTYDNKGKDLVNCEEFDAVMRRAVENLKQRDGI